MSPDSNIPNEIVSFCERCSKVLSGLTEPGEQVEYIRGKLPELLENKRLFADLLLDVIEGSGYPDLRRVTMFDNELFLCSDKARRFSFRMFLWAPGEYTPVHDHGSWGVIGPVTGRLDVIDYAREDDGSKEDRARLVEKNRLRLQPAETTFTLPLDDGIHKVGNPTEQTILSLSIYGKPLPRGYITGFDIAAGRAYRILAPHTRKKLLMIQALPGLDAAAGEKALRQMRGQPVKVFEQVGLAGFGKLT
jgi:predicted metal-dependent enzyme (double-stranded beta helix superfamily)